ncbi:MAG: DUF2975 domain-containing protein [Ginsengibacter sp.]
MKTRTEIVLIVLKYLALLGGIGFSLECGAQILSFVASFINPVWAERTYLADPIWFQILDYDPGFYTVLMILIIAASALKAWVWFLIFELLHKLQLKSPFSFFVTKRLELISYMLLAVWFVMTFMAKSYAHYLQKASDIILPGKYISDEYFFVAGIVFILSQLFKRGMEMQEENQLTV